ncbi:MAG: TIGR04076 family protein [Candidatus Amulumruptor caecigallinarius]|nr:TIGR04076 family protein [Candidatus Amulumruptor caecigallinarius]MCM1397369.1 TIGR04076 family protein [Candidatus Amulumruptor caecigallinarius]MCM1454737.1 TIGR04076 family protein [bacterium]
MDRRRFLKVGGLLAAAAALSPGKLLGAGRLSPAAAVAGAGRGCRVTVIRRECFTDIQSRYLDDPEAGPCRVFRQGESFDCSDGCMPRGFCPKAWECIRAHVDAVLSTADPLQCGDAPADRAVIACCNDGTRPVIFKIEPAG